MRLESALNTGREGITAHGQAIAVVGDNISNANTVGYKTGRAVFGDILGETPGDRVSEVVSGAGDGVTVRDIRLDYQAGPIQSTGRDLDVALGGNGFFQVGALDNIQYTRSGSFEINKDGLLVTSFGLPVLGYTGTDTATLGTIDMRTIQQQVLPTTQVSLFGNLNSSSTISVPPANPLSFREINIAAAFNNTTTVFDSLGERHDINFAFFKTGSNSWSVRAYVNGSDVGGTPDQPVQVGQGTLTFDSSGRIPPNALAQATIAINANWNNGSAPSAVGFNLSGLTQYGGSSLVNNITQDGQGKVEIDGYQITPEGAIFAMLSDGKRAQVGTLSIANVTNQDGLVRSGTSTYKDDGSAGTITTGTAGTGPASRLISKSLEYSNVDLAGQFVDLVVLQRGYSANSKVISTASEIIKDTIGLIR